MRLQNIKLSLIRDNNFEGIQVIEKIQNCVKKYNISINKSITYLLSKYQSQYQKRILDICRAVYPYDGEVDFSKFIKNENQIDQIEFMPVHKIGSFKKSKDRIQHIEDLETYSKKIGISPQAILKNNINKNMQILTEIIDPDTLIQKKKSVKKRKKRID